MTWFQNPMLFTFFTRQNFGKKIAIAISKQTTIERRGQLFLLKIAQQLCAICFLGADRSPFYIYIYNNNIYNKTLPALLYIWIHTCIYNHRNQVTSCRDIEQGGSKQSETGRSAMAQQQAWRVSQSGLALALLLALLAAAMEHSLAAAEYDLAKSSAAEMDRSRLPRRRRRISVRDRNAARSGCQEGGGG